jgi:hypothetical protein
LSSLRVVKHDRRTMAPMFFLADGSKYSIMYSMKSSDRVAIFGLIIALIGQGIFPGVVLCRGEAGHVAVETTLDQCCSSFVRARMHASLSLYELESAAHGSCGPCSDILISTNPFRIPAAGHYSSTGPVQVATIPASGIVSQTKKLFVSIVNPTCLALVSIKTTFLLL